ncbi:uncharacterized protein RCO7_14576 [Rhynchosporium graminicola]|uniref:Uncharacterized protein n=1 Tax=Rhynchosporium graminicola TaxID=2792576 RepID=A0A1E1KSX3_9HELO|nr:uncharacterized protein RCO7_14576 [Rhynchosporium commune]
MSSSSISLPFEPADPSHRSTSCTTCSGVAGKGTSFCPPCRMETKSNLKEDITSCAKLSLETEAALKFFNAPRGSQVVNAVWTSSLPSWTSFPRVTTFETYFDKPQDFLSSHHYSSGATTEKSQLLLPAEIGWTTKDFL